MTELDQLRAKLAEAQAEIERLKAEYAEDVGKLLRLTKYIAGVAERGLGVQQPDSVSVEDFVLSYVKQLEQQLAEAQAEIERLKERQDFAPDQWWIKELASVDTTLAPLTHDQYRAVRIAVTAINVLMHENAASQATNEKLREALNRIPEMEWWEDVRSIVREALALPNDTTALNKLLAGVYEECAKECDRLDYWYSARAIRALAKQKGCM